MGRLFFWLFVGVVALLLLLFFPIIMDTDIHGDLNKKKLTFLVRLYGKIKLFGGYATAYKGGVALHLSNDKALLKPFNQMNDERKRFSFIKTFKPIEFTLTTETGAEYLFYVAAVHAALRIYFFAIGGEKENIENNLWLTDGDVLRVSLHSAVFFNVYILLSNLFKAIKEKIKTYARKK